LLAFFGRGHGFGPEIALAGDGQQMKVAAAKQSPVGQPAFTLVEVLVASALLSLAAATLYSGLAWGIKQNRLARENLRATQVILEKLELLRGYSWDQLFPNSDPDELEDPLDPFDPDDDPHLEEDDVAFTIPRTFTAAYETGDTNKGDFMYQGVIEITPAQITEAYSASLARVRVAVGWTSGGVRREREAKTFFAQYGLQNNLTR
jgi:prepilin-type N-terminal cleavage/methylation domain-containing protein